MASLEIRPIDIVSLPDLAVPCLKSGCMGGGVTVQVHKAEAMTRKKLAFFHERRADGAAAQVAYMDGRPVGMIEHCPIESAPVPILGEDLYVILCMQISAPTGEEEIEQSLVSAALDTWSSRKGAIVLGEKRDWSRHGFEPIWRDCWPDGRDLTLWLLKFWDAEPPVPVPLAVKGISPGNGVLVQVFDPGFCPWISFVIDKVIDVAVQFGPGVEVERVDCSLRANVLHYGLSAGIAVNGRIQPWLRPHPLPTDVEIREKIEYYL